MALIDKYADRLEWQEDGPVSLTLRKPLKVGDGEVKVLTLQRLKLEDLLANDDAGGDDLTKTAMLISRVAGVKMTELDEADAGDSMVLAEVIAKMLEYGEDGTLLERHADRLTITEYDAQLKLLSPVASLSALQDTENEIVMRRPSLKEVRTNQGKTLKASVKLLAILTGIGPAKLGKLDAIDGLILSALVRDFLGDAPRSPTG